MLVQHWGQSSMREEVTGLDACGPYPVPAHLASFGMQVAAIVVVVVVVMRIAAGAAEGSLQIAVGEEYCIGPGVQGDLGILGGRGELEAVDRH